MTDQRERVTTDPGIGPANPDNTATLRSIEAAVEVEPDGSSLYYEPTPLRAASDHRTLEIQTVKLSEQIDPRKLPTQLSLPRASVPPQYDSGWPQAEVVLTSSQPPSAPRRRWRVPVLLLGVLVALLLLVIARSSVRRAAEQSAAASPARDVVTLPAVAAAAVGLPGNNAAPRSAEPSAAAPSANAEPSESAEPSASAEPPTAEPSASAPPTTSAEPSTAAASPSHGVTPTFAVVPHHAALKASPQPSDPAASAPTVKPKRAIY